MLADRQARCLLMSHGGQPTPDAPLRFAEGLSLSPEDGWSGLGLCLLRFCRWVLRFCLPGAPGVEWFGFCEVEWVLVFVRFALLRGCAADVTLFRSDFVPFALREFFDP